MAGDVNYYREPCPGRIIGDLGVAFSIGCIGGGIFYTIKGKIFDKLFFIIFW